MPSDRKPLLSLTSTAESPLHPIRMVAHEIICDLFRFEIEVVPTTDDRIDMKAMLKDAGFTVQMQITQIGRAHV